jgi:hypothetical protein
MDYYDLTNIDRIASADPQLMLNSLPALVIRDAPSAADQAAGLPGRVTGFHSIPVNLAYYRQAGVDLEARYQRPLGNWGEVLFRGVVTKPTVSRMQTNAAASLFDDLPGREWRGTGALSWLRGPVELGAVATYTGDYFSGRSESSAGNPVQPVTLWDFHCSYDFGRNGNGYSDWRKHVLNDLRVGLFVINAFNVEPQLSVAKATVGNVDPRGRRYQLTLSKMF